MQKEQAPSPYQHYSESPYLTFWGTDLHIPDDPVSEEQFYTTRHCLEHMTIDATEGEQGPAITPQLVSAELSHFNQTVTAIRQGAGVPQPAVHVTLEQLHALSLRRLLATYDTQGAQRHEYERFVHVHAAIFLALHEEQAAAQFMAASTTEQGYSEDDVPF